MRLIRKLSFVLIAILVLLISAGFSYAQQNYIGEDEIVIDGNVYKNVETEFQRPSNPNEGTAPVYLNQDFYPNLDGQTISPTVICEDVSEANCISIINLDAIAIGEPVYGDIYEQTSLWQKISYNGQIYYAPYDRLDFEPVAQPVIPTQNPSSGYTGDTINAYNPDCQKIDCNYDDEDYERDQHVASDQQHGQAFAELTGGGLVNSALWVWDGVLSIFSMSNKSTPPFNDSMLTINRPEGEQDTWLRDNIIENWGNDKPNLFFEKNENIKLINLESDSEFERKMAEYNPATAYLTNGQYALVNSNGSIPVGFSDVYPTPVPMVESMTMDEIAQTYSMLLGVIPVAGDTYSLITFLTGTDIVTGKKLNHVERTAAFISIIPILTMESSVPLVDAAFQALQIMLPELVEDNTKSS